VKTTKSIESEIDRAISNYKRGKIFFPSSFLKFGSSTAVRKALDRLKDKGRLVRIAHGIYLYPKQDKLLGILYPTVEEVALAISKRDKSRIIPTGVNALNKLGLSSQVPMNVVYLTDGTPRVVKVYNRTIKFKIASPKLLSAKNTTNILVIQALREIQKDNVDQNILDKILDVLKNVNKEDIKHDMNLAPAWIREIMEKAVIESK
jgi:predicted transcriptional regulator of viral defense system